MDKRELRNLISSTYSAFFARFSTFKPIQRLVIPKVLRGRDLVVVSPTASGKTEAILAPLIERLIESGKLDGLRLIWVAPTRALVNDLYMRFSGPLDLLHIKFIRKTGDHPTLSVKSLPTVLLTTPESLDSMLCRYPKELSELTQLVLDDVHLLDNTPRGDQLEILLRRLRRLVKEKIQVIAASATIPEPVKLGNKYLSEDFDIAVATEGRPIEFFLMPWGKDTVNLLVEDFKKRGFNKILVFANSRIEAERLQKDFDVPPFKGRTFVHHGSLSKRERESIEDWMNRTRSGLVVATTTLELGIDIGDIDAVVLYEPPHDIQSFLQRIGRGNRRREQAVGYGIFHDAWERMIFEIYFEDASSGIIGEAKEASFVSVAVQQVLSYMYQRRRVGATYKNFYEVIAPLVEEEELYLILEHLEDLGFLKKIMRGVYGPDELLLNAGEKGWIHSNIERGFWDYRIVDIGSGKEIGQIQLISPQFELGGKLWEVVAVEKKTAWVRPIKAIFKGAGKIFKGKALFWDYRLGDRIRERFFAELGANGIPYLKINDTLIIFHFFGPLQGFLWEKTLRNRGKDAQDFSGRVLVINDVEMGVVESIPTHEELKRAILENMGVFTKFLSLGAFYRYLPKELQPKAVEKALEIETLIEKFNNIEFVEITPERATPILEIIGPV